MTLIHVALPPQYVLLTEFHLRRLPQRIDLLIIRREAAPPPGVHFLPALLTQLTDLTLLEFKGGTDGVSMEDPSTLLGYACQYEQHWRAELRRKQRTERSTTSAPQTRETPPTLPDLSLGFIAPRLTETFRRGLQFWGGSLETIRPGLHQGRLANRPLFFIETEVIWKASHPDRFFYVLTRDFLRHGLPTEDMTEEELDVYNTVEHWFMRELKEKSMMFQEEKLKEIREANRRFKEEFLNELTPEERMKGLPAEARLQGLGLADRLLDLTPAQREELKKML